MNQSNSNHSENSGGGIPKYQWLMDTLTRDIHSLKYPAGSLIPSEHELAKRYRISRHTVRAALLQMERQGYLARRRGKGTFVQYPPVRPGDAKGEIGILVPCVTISLYPEVVRGAEDIVTEAGRHLIIGSYDVQPRKERMYIESMLEKPVAGMILCPSYNSTASIYQALVHHHMPFVLVDTAVDGVDADLIATNGFEGAREGVHRLVASGCRDLAFLCGYLSASTSRERLAGFRTGIEDAGLPWNDARIIEGDFSEAFGLATAHKMLAMPTPPDGLLIANDPIAVGVISALHDAGVAVPETMRLCVFDEPDLPLPLRVPLTVIRQPRRAIGEAAARRLLTRIEERRSNQPRTPSQTLRLAPEVLD